MLIVVKEEEEEEEEEKEERNKNKSEQKRKRKRQKHATIEIQWDQSIDNMIGWRAHSKPNSWP